jgi:hypothetical protein
MKIFVTFILMLSSVFGCSPKMTQVSGRNPDLFTKESDKLVGQGRPMSGTTVPAVYVKEKTVQITNNTRTNDSGSLFNTDDERNYLFTPKGPLNVGRFLTVNILPNRLSEKDLAKDKTGAKAKGKGKDDKSAPTDEVEEELLKALPDLTPAEKGQPSLLKSFKMQIAHRYDNGDVLAMLKRTSQHKDQASEVDLRARIPYDRLSSGDDLTTDDLLDVRFAESKAGELTERNSSGWEDEYSLRLSGFEEAKSKQAQDLADQKDRLQEAQEKLENRIKSFGDERRLVAKQREDLAKKRAETDAKMKLIEDTLKEQEAAKAAADAAAAADPKGDKAKAGNNAPAKDAGKSGTADAGKPAGGGNNNA